MDAETSPVLTFALTCRRRGASVSDQGFYVVADALAQDELVQGGVVRAVFRRADGRGNVFLLETENLAMAWQYLEKYPSVATDVAQFLLMAIEAARLQFSAFGPDARSVRKLKSGGDKR